MTVFQTIALLLTFAACGAYFNYQFLKLPATIGLMAFALLLSLTAILLNWLNWVNLGAASAFVSQIDFSDVLLHGMLSFLLFAGALHINISELRRYQGIIAIMATVGVVIATFVTGTLIWYAANLCGLTLPYLYALVFGALIAPTDPVAVLGILQQTGMSRNLRVKIGCESLLNDGVGVVLFVIMLGLATQAEGFSLNVKDVILLLLWEGVGSILLGLTLGWITYRFLARIDDYKIEVLMTLALVAGVYSLGEIIHVSAPITIVIAGLVIGNHGRAFGMTDKTRKHLDMFWDLLDEILNAILFMLMGLEMMVMTITRLDFALGLLAITAMLIGRFVSVSLPVYLLHFRYRFERGTIPLLTWGGLRGGISIALALSIPAGPQKDLILDMTYIVVLFSILVQGTTFGRVAKAIVGKQNVIP